MKQDRGPAQTVFLAFLLLVMSLILGKVQAKSRAAGVVDPVGRVVRPVVLPLSATLTGAANTCSDFFGGVFGARELSRRNRELEALAKSAELYQQTLESQQREIDELRTMFSLPKDPSQKVVADIIGTQPSQSLLTLNKGKLDGVLPGAAVLTVKGILGRIQAVEAHTSTVQLMTSASLRIGGMTQTNPPSAGLVKGLGSNLLIMDFADPQAPVKVNDKIVTSGFDKIKRNIPIGTVIQVEDNSDFGVRQARIYPAVTLGDSREVFVLK